MRQIPLKVLQYFASMTSEEGKQSMKRGISGVFTITIIFMVWWMTTKTIPTVNQIVFTHCFDTLCIMVGILTGVATIKDIVVLVRGKDAVKDLS